MLFSIELYENPNGESVVERELEEIERRWPVLHALLLAGLNKLKQREYHKPPLCLPLGGGLFELRVGGRDIARGLWFYQAGQRIVVLHCFVKKTQKTSADDRRLAEQRMAEYRARYR